jgi:hypothetical protein
MVVNVRLVVLSFLFVVFIIPSGKCYDNLFK